MFTIHTLRFNFAFNFVALGLNTMQSISTSVPRSAIAGKRKGSRIRLERLATIIAFLLPAAALYTLLVIFPVVQAAYFSVFKWNGLGPATNFVGVENYIRILSDEIFQKAVWHNLCL
jgi:raffinose/stachyose/melibiose transport system permease protein